MGHPRIMRAASDDDTMLDAERNASPFCAGRAIVVNENEPEESARDFLRTLFQRIGISPASLLEPEPLFATQWLKQGAFEGAGD